MQGIWSVFAMRRGAARKAGPPVHDDLVVPSFTDRAYRQMSTLQAFRSEADDEARTRDPQLGKLMLYQLSYVRRGSRLARETGPFDGID